MNNISEIKSRILQFLDYQNIKKSVFYRETGIANGVLDKSTGLNETNISRITSTYPEISARWLLTGQGKMLWKDEVEANLKALNIKTAEDTLRRLHEKEKAAFDPKVIVVDKSGNEGVHIPIVQGKAYAGYLSGYSQEEFIRELPTISISKEYLGSGTLRGFNIEGDSMEPHIITRDVVIGEFADSPRKLQPGTVAVFVTRDDGVVCKRFDKFTDGRCLLMSDNPRYSTSGILADDIVEVWKVIGLIRKLLI